MVDMTKKEILPAVCAYTKDLAESAAVIKQAAPGAACRYEQETVARLSGLADEISDAVNSLEEEIIKFKAVDDVTKASCMIRDVILQKMAELRVVCDEAESLTAEKYWPFPTYGDLLFSVK